MIEFSIDRQSLDTMRTMLRKMPAVIQQKVLRHSLGQGMKIVQQKVKSFAPVDTGSLKRSHAMRTKVYRSRGVIWVGLGPKVEAPPRPPSLRTRIGKWLGVKQKATKRRRRSKTVKPSNYAWLVEHGHRIARGGTLLRTTQMRKWRGHNRRILKGYRSGKIRRGSLAGFVQPNPYMKTAFNASKDLATAVIITESVKRLDKEMDKLAQANGVKK